jgi:predicted dehydrogenase
MAKFNNASLVGLATATGRTAKAVGDQYKFGLCTTDYRELLANENITAA